MARKNLTALAALGTLGYMLSKKGDKKDEKSTSAAAERRIAADKVDSEIPEPLDVARNLDDDLYSDTGSKKGRGAAGTSETVSAPSRASADASKKPAASSGKPSSGAAKNLTSSESQAARNALGEGSYKQDSVYNPDKKGITSETRVPRFTPDGPPVSSNLKREEKTAKAAPVDVTKLSFAERRKLSLENPSSSGPTDYRPANERIRETFGLKKGGKVKKMASGGMTSSASKRADGIATKGKTRGRMC